MAMAVEVSDESLAEGILGGDEAAFRLLYERYRRPVYATAYRIIQSPEDARDATQEIFLKLFRSLRQWRRNRSSLSTWLYRLASNHAIDCWRARRRRAEFSSDEELPGHGSERLGLEEAFLSPYRAVESRELVDEIQRAIDRLPDLQKRVFVLRYFQELKLEEIAELENCSLGTVKTSLFRATQALRRAVRRHQDSR